MQAKQTKITTVLPQQNDEPIPVSVPFSPLSKHQGNSPFAPRSPLDPIPTVSEEKYSPPFGNPYPVSAELLQNPGHSRSHGRSPFSQKAALHCNPQENHTQLCSPCIKTNLRPLAPTKHHFSP